MNPNIWDCARPMTHGWARPEVAEHSALVKLIAYTLAENYKGKLHICHVSSPMSVFLVRLAKSWGLDITCEATPQHCMYSEEMMLRSDGLQYKINPPLRDMRTVLALRERLKAGDIDVLATDQAPHTQKQKEAPVCLSGFPGLSIYRQCVEGFLPYLGLTIPQIKTLTFDNPRKIIGDKL